MNSRLKTASDVGMPKKEEKRPSIGNPLPEAYIKAYSAPVRACGELAFEVWEIYEGPRSEPPKK